MTMEKKILLQWKRDGQPMTDELTIRFSMAVEIAYEDISGEPFSFDGLSKKKNLIALYEAAIITANKEPKVTVDDLLLWLDNEQLMKIDNAISECMREWMHIPAVMQDETDAGQEETSEKK